MNDVQLNVFSQSSFLDFSMTRRFVTGDGPTEKNPISADSSINIEMLEVKYIDAHVRAIAMEQTAIMVLRHCIESISLPQKIAPIVVARFERNKAIATSRTSPPNDNM